MARTFTKSGDNNLGEAAGLRWLAEAQPTGGARVAAVIAADEDHLEIEHIAEARPSSAGARAFGRALAHTHAAGAPWWGCPPDDWHGPPWVGTSRTPLVLDSRQAPTAWGTFFAVHRVEVYARQLHDAGAIDSTAAATFRDLADRLEAGDFDAPQPRLVRDAGHTVARVHGDMWSGNVLYDGSSTGAALIDPMAHGGHAETDLATLSVFGFPHLDDIYAGYSSESPLADDWHERVELHQLGIVIMHAHLFGGGYVNASVRLAKRYA